MIIKDQNISSLIYLISGEKVILDFAHANLYGVETRSLKENKEKY